MTADDCPFISGNNKLSNYYCVGHKMSNNDIPGIQDKRAIVEFRHTLKQLSLKDTETNLNRALDEMAQFCIEKVAVDMRDAYCNFKQLHILPMEFRSHLKSEAVLFFIEHNKKLNRQLSRNDASLSENGSV